MQKRFVPVLTPMAERVRKWETSRPGTREQLRSVSKWLSLLLYPAFCCSFLALQFRHGGACQRTRRRRIPYRNRDVIGAHTCEAGPCLTQQCVMSEGRETWQAASKRRRDLLIPHRHLR